MEKNLYVQLPVFGKIGPHLQHALGQLNFSFVEQPWRNDQTLQLISVVDSCVVFI